MRVNLNGQGQALDGDSTSTGAICIASGDSYWSEGRLVLRQGDTTTACPLCNEIGVIAEGTPYFISDGRPVVVDGALVACGCPSGSNRVVAPLHSAVPSVQGAPVVSSAGGSSRSYVPDPASNLSPASPYSVQATASGTSDNLEPGFYIVPRSLSFSQVLVRLNGEHAALPISRLQRLNPTFEQGFKAGEIFVIGDPDNGHACTREEAQLMAAAQRAREAMTDLGQEEADFMMRNQAEIASLLGDASLSMGVAQAMMAKGLQDLEATLREIERLHQREFAQHGHLKSANFFASRKQLFTRLSAQLKVGLLNKHMDLGSHETLRRDLGISSKSLVHHWSKAGGPGQIPGYATYLDKVARMAKYLKYGGHISIGLGGASSYLKVQEVCRAGETEACKKIRVTEAASFSAALGGGMLGGTMTGRAGLKLCVRLGPVGGTICSLALTGAGSWAGSVIGMSLGENVGELLYDFSRHE